MWEGDVLVEKENELNTTSQLKLFHDHLCNSSESDDHVTLKNICIHVKGK